MRACVRVCVCACVRACVYVRASVRERARVCIVYIMYLRTCVLFVHVCRCLCAHVRARARNTHTRPYTKCQVSPTEQIPEVANIDGIKHATTEPARVHLYDWCSKTLILTVTSVRCAEQRNAHTVYALWYVVGRMEVIARLEQCRGTCLRRPLGTRRPLRLFFLEIGELLHKTGVINHTL